MGPQGRRNPLGAAGEVMPDRPLQLAQASITTLSYACPVCERVLEFDSSDLEEDAGGAVAPAGPHRFPRCYECDTQFECAPVQLTTLAAKPARRSE